MSMTLIALLVALLPPLQTAATSKVIPADVDRLVRAAQKLTGAWPSQPPPPVPEVAIVARHGTAVVPLLVELLSDDPNAERDRRRSARISDYRKDSHGSLFAFRWAGDPWRELERTGADSC